MCNCNHLREKGIDGRFVADIELGFCMHNKHGNPIGNALVSNIDFEFGSSMHTPSSKAQK